MFIMVGAHTYVSDSITEGRYPTVINVHGNNIQYVKGCPAARGRRGEFPSRHRPNILIKPCMEHNEPTMWLKACIPDFTNWLSPNMHQ